MKLIPIKEYIKAEHDGIRRQFCQEWRLPENSVKRMEEAKKPVYVLSGPSEPLRVVSELAVKTK